VGVVAHVQVWVLCASGLVAKNKGGHSDPYVTLRLEGNLTDRSILNLGTNTWFMKDAKDKKPARTKTIMKTLEPQWYECFEFFLPLEAEDAKLVFNVYDANMLSDVPLGTTELRYKHLVRPQPAPKALALKEMETRKKRRGSRKPKAAPAVSGFLDVLVYASDLRSVATAYPPNYSEDESALESPGFGYSSSEYGYTTTDDEDDNRSLRSSKSSAGDLEEDDDDDDDEPILAESGRRIIDRAGPVPPLDLQSAQAAEEEVVTAAANGNEVE